VNVMLTVPSKSVLSQPITLRVTHDTVYEYGAPVQTAFHLACLRLVAANWQRVLWQRLVILPTPAEQTLFADAFGNERDLFSLASLHDTLTVRSEAMVALFPRTAPDALASQPWEQVRDSLTYRGGAPFVPACEFTFPSSHARPDRDIKEFAVECFPAGVPILIGALVLMERIHDAFTFDSESTHVGTTAAEAFRHKKGVCQDLAHVMIAGLRSIGLAARYVSGYLLTEPPPGQPRLVGADASHAWASVWCPPFGWIDLDPTNNMRVGLTHITVAAGRDYGDVPPVRGVIQGGGDHQIRVAVTVMPIEEEERPGTV
jgi:transglutaminase-like putative cysteine protease